MILFVLMRSMFPADVVCDPVRGESSEEQRAQAKALGISTLNLSGFCELLKWGLLMGVDDGCEPTPEEVEAQVYQGPPVWMNCISMLSL